MIRRGEVEIEETPGKGPTALSNATSTVEQRDESYPSSSETNEGIPMVSLPQLAVLIKFITDDDDVAIQICLLFHQKHQPYTSFT